MFALLLAACAGPELSPASGSMTGYFPVEVTGLRAPADVTGATLGGVRAYGLEVRADALVLHVQGSPEPGDVDLVLETADGDQRVEHAFTYDAPAADLGRVVAIGASLSQGVQGGVPSAHGALHAPSFQLAGLAGVYHPLPLLVDPLFPSIGAADIGPPPECAVPDVPSFVADAAIDVLGRLNDADNDRIGFYLARVDPDIAPYDVAVGDSNVADVVNGPAPEFAQQFIAKMVMDPYRAIDEDIPFSQLDLIDAIGPDVVLCADTYGNDVIGAIVQSDDVDVSKVTPDADMEAAIGALVDRLAATGAEVFLANLPRPSLLPVTEARRRHVVAEAREDAVARGDDPDEAAAEALTAIDARIAQVDAAGLRFGAMLETAASAHPRVHVVDLYGRVEQIDAEGLAIGDVTLTTAKLGGLLSTDGVHFSDVGYGLVAQTFAEAIEDALGSEIPDVDYAALLAGDPYAPAALRAAGLDPDACD